MSNNTPPRIFVLASEEARTEALAKSKTWVNQKNQTMFHEDEKTCATAVAEYILNEKGFTLFSVNAKYPKSA